MQLRRSRTTARQDHTAARTCRSGTALDKEALINRPQRPATGSAEAVPPESDGRLREALSHRPAGIHSPKSSLAGPGGGSVATMEAKSLPRPHHSLIGITVPCP